MHNSNFSILLSLREICLNNYTIILHGIFITILVSVVASVLAFFLGTVFVYYRLSPSLLVRKLTSFVVACVRNTPLLIIIYLFYKGLPSIGIVFSALTCGILALGIYTAAYISDSLLSGINAVPREHTQAAKALGFTRVQSFIHIIYPQALRHSIFLLGSQFMNLIKNSSLVSFISVTDIFYVFYKGISDSYRLYEYFILTVVVYCVLTWFVLLVVNILERIYKIPTMEVRA